MESIFSGVCQTVYPPKEYLSSPAIYALAGANILLALSIVSVNSFLIYALYKTKQLRKLSSRLIAYLALSDCCVGIFMVFIIIHLLRRKGGSTCLFELLAQFTCVLFSEFSALQIMIIALDRFLRMKFLNRYQEYMTRRRAALMMLFNAAMSVSFAVGSVVASISGHFYTYNIVFVSINSPFFMTVYIMYPWTYVSVHRQISQARQRQTQRVNDSSRQADSALAKTMIFILIAVAICYLPYMVLGLAWSHFYFNKGVVSSSFLPNLAVLTWWTFYLIHLNSTLNALIFITRNKKIMEVLRGISFRSKENWDTTSTERSIDR